MHNLSSCTFGYDKRVVYTPRVTSVGLGKDTPPYGLYPIKECVSIRVHREYTPIAIEVLRGVLGGLLNGLPMYSKSTPRSINIEHG